MVFYYKCRSAFVSAVYKFPLTAALISSKSLIIDVLMYLLT